MIRRLLTLWLALGALGFIFAGQTWWQLSINTGDSVASVSGTGFDADKSISAILMFNLAALLFVAFSRGWTTVAITVASAAATVLLLVNTVTNVLNQNIGGITANVSKHTGFEMNPILGLNEPQFVSGQLQVWAWLTLATLVLLASIQLIFALKYRGWAKAAKPKSDRTKPKQETSENGDTISLWDSQRG